MEPENLHALQYPIGKFEAPETISDDMLKNYIFQIKGLPAIIEQEIKNCSKKDLSKIYRPGGWSIKQVVNHLADSHAICHSRFKLALTEDLPTIKPYQEAEWANLSDGIMDDLSGASMMLAGIHIRWVVLLENMSKDDFNRKFYHPKNKKEYSLRLATGLYAWHGNHHLAHIKNALANNF